MPDADNKFNDIRQNLAEVREKIADAALKSGRKPEEIKLMAVSKTIESKYINYAISEGIDLIGENKVQEFLAKEPELNLQNCKAHLIGHLQSNKVRKIVGKVDVIQSVDSVSLATEIAKRSRENGIVSKILLEVNVGNEESKFGFDLNEINERVFEISEIDDISIQGLMCVAPICDDEKVLRHIFFKYVSLIS